MTARILIADDHATFRSGLRTALDLQDDLDCVAEVADGQAAVTETARLAPDLAVLDVQMPKLSGIGAAEAILAVPGTATRVLMLTSYDADEYIHRALVAGASGFLLKSSSPEELVAGIRVALRGDAVIDPAVTRRLASRFAAAIAPTPRAPGLDTLTVRERQVFDLLVTGRTNTEIASLLFVGDQTVKSHVSNVLAKLNLRDRVHAVLYAHRHNITLP